MLAQRALPEDQRNESNIRKLHHAFEQDYRDNWGIATKLYPGIAEMLDHLIKIGMKLTILSNKPHEFTLTTAGHFLANWNFQCVFGQREGVPKKPDPAGILEISQELSIPPQNMLYLGDSGVDMKTARAAGCHAIGVTWGFRSQEELLESGAENLIENPNELLPLIDSLQA